jgi:hypothetical protein
MKSKMALLWFIVSLALAATLFVQMRNARKQKLLLEKLQLQIENDSHSSQAKVKDLEKSSMMLRGQLQAAEGELASARGAYQALAQKMNSAPASSAAAGNSSANASSGGADSKPPGNFLASMLKDPEMKKAMAEQQRMAMDMMYNSLLKKLQLSPEKEQEFKKIMLDQQMSNLDQAQAMMDQSNTNRAELAQKMAQERDQRDEQLKQLLGDDDYTKYKNYTQTMGERMMLDQFGKQIDLKPDQTDQLLDIMREEKKNVQINQGAPPFDPTKDWQQVIQDDGAAEKLFSQQEQANQRVLERAGQILTPEQIQQLGPVLQSQLEMQRAGMKMARKMFAPAGPGAAPQSVPATQ